jgi:zinc/manganese transport system substrate-binding protein
MAPTSIEGAVVKKIGFLLLSLGCCSLAAADVNVFSCEPEWKALAEQIGGERINAYSATTAGQDPHHIQARPSLIARLRQADLLICSGADLEAGWLPLLLRRARNAKVQPGQPGHLMAAGQVQRLELPERLDRSEGDIHAQGNPHVHLDPRNLVSVARVLADRLAQIDSEYAGDYRSRLAVFEAHWAQAIADWERRAARLRDNSVVVHHREWVYLLHWLGMQRLASLEPKPGVPASVGHLAGLQSLLQQKQPLAIVRSPINDPQPSEWLSDRSGVTALVLPYTVGSTEDAKDLHALFEGIINRLLSISG